MAGFQKTKDCPRCRYNRPHDCDPPGVLIPPKLKRGWDGHCPDFKPKTKKVARRDMK